MKTNNCTISRKIGLSDFNYKSFSLQDLTEKESKKRIREYCRFEPNRFWQLQRIKTTNLGCPFLPTRYNIQMRIVDSKTKFYFNGTAEADNLYIAMNKAFAEAYERYTYKVKQQRYKTSNGFAAHTNIEKACLNAFCESIERDTILTAWSNRSRPIAQLSPKNFPIPLRKLNRYGYHISFFQMPVLSNSFPHVILAIIQPQSRNGFWKTIYPNSFGGRICGFGCSFSLSEAVWKAYRESILIAWPIFLNPDSLRTENDKELPNLFHYLFYLRPENIVAFDFIEKIRLSEIQFNYECYAQQNHFADMENLIREERIDIHWKLFADRQIGDPFYVVKAVSPIFQELRFGSDDNSVTKKTWPHPIA